MRKACQDEANGDVSRKLRVMKDLEREEARNFLPFMGGALRQWFLKNRRDLPWRQDPSPYRVWISEVMLQQTQVAVVTLYFERWMEKFPSIQALAKASLEEVIKTWEGLGYYSRARNLHQGAVYLNEHHGGEIPSSLEALKKIPGIGGYTAGAILSFAFKQKAPAIDGNVLRVMSRYLKLEEEIEDQKTQAAIRAYVQEVLPEEEPWIISEGLIELGALVCGKQPKCFACPLSSGCQGLKYQIADLLPKKRKKMPVTPLKRDVFIVVAEGKVLLSKGEKGRVMADLYEFPYQDEGGDFLGLDRAQSTPLETVKHTFTRFRVTLSPYLFYVEKARDVPGYFWVPLSEVGQLPFSSGHKKLCGFLLQA